MGPLPAGEVIDVGETRTFGTLPRFRIPDRKHVAKQTDGFAEITVLACWDWGLEGLNTPPGLTCFPEHGDSPGLAGFSDGSPWPVEGEILERVLRQSTYIQFSRL